MIALHAVAAAAAETSIPWAALIPLLVVAVGFVVYCWVDIARHEVRHLPRWAWALICAISVPLGGIIYLLIGREPTVRRP